MSHYRKCLMYILNRIDFLMSEEHRKETVEYLKKEFGEDSYSAMNPEPYILGEIKGESLWTKYMLTNDLSVLKID